MFIFLVQICLGWNFGLVSITLSSTVAPARLSFKFGCLLEGEKVNIVLLSSLIELELVEKNDLQL